MSFERLRYRKYASDEIAALLAPETVWYSRRVSFNDNAVSRADTITAAAVQTAAGALQLTVRAVFCNTMDSITALLAADGFVVRPTAGGTVHERVWSSTIDRREDTAAAFARVVGAVDEAAAGLPLLLYSSRARKVVADYLQVVKFAGTQAPVRKLSADIGECAEAARLQAPVFFVTPTADAAWVAWLHGDEFAPAFPSQNAAVAFAKGRQRLLGLEDNAIGIVEPPARNVYRLIDNKKSLRERILWLRHESARLERLLPAFDPRLERAE